MTLNRFSCLLMSSLMAPTTPETSLTAASKSYENV